MPIQYTVQPGDCISSIAAAHGFKPETIWDDASNADLKNLRKDMNILMEGDVVQIPDLRLRVVPCATDKLHIFQRIGVPEKFQITLLDHRHLPRANVKYTLSIEGACTSGYTDATGKIEAPIPPMAQQGMLTVFDGPVTEEYPLYLGRMDPITELTGVQMRLKNLGFRCPTGGDMDDGTVAALKEFQESKDLPATGELDDATRGKLADTHGS